MSDTNISPPEQNNADIKVAFCHRCGAETPRESLFCRICGVRLTEASGHSDVTPSLKSDPKTERSKTGHVGPIFLMVSLLAVAIAATIAYVVGKGSRPGYTYLKEGTIQFRVDERSGRTDRLGSTGWEPFSYDSSSEELPTSVVTLGNSTWESGFSTPPPGRICFDAHNHSGSVVQDVKISISFDPKPADYPTGAGGDPGNVDDFIFGEYSTLKPDRENLLAAGKDGRVCGTAPRVFPTGAKWSYTVLRVRGWKE